MPGGRGIHQVRVVDAEGNPNYITWIESCCGKFYYILEENTNSSSLAVREAEWDLMKGKDTPGAHQLSKFPLIFTNPNDLHRGKNK